MDIARIRSMNKGAAGAALCVFLLQAAGASAGELAAVVSSVSNPYTEAMGGFKNGIKSQFDYYDSSKPGFVTPEDARFVAAFGVKAAALDYPPGTHLVYALAPIARRGPGAHEISMLPAPAEALQAYKTLQPQLGRLAVFWSKYPGEGYLEELARAGEPLGVKILPVRIKSPDFFPERLRSLMGKMDAFWLMPDPALINKSGLLVLANFSCANSIPFYAPTYALVLEGATASFSPDFTAAGAAAAQAITLIMKGGEQPKVVYPDRSAMRVNDALRGKCGWPLK